METYIQYCNRENENDNQEEQVKDEEEVVEEEGMEQESQRITTIPRNRNGFIVQSLSAMVGDVNLFLSEYSPSDDDDDENENENDDNKTASSTIRLLQGEIDIMIADTTLRNQGYGYEAVLFMMLYSAMSIPEPSSSSSSSTTTTTTTPNRPGRIVRYFCKIHKDNTASQYLFTEKLHFVQCHYTECFQEYEYEFCCCNDEEDNDGATLSHRPNAMLDTIWSRILHATTSTPPPPYPTTKSTTTTSTNVPSSSSSVSPIRIIPCPLS